MSVKHQYIELQDRVYSRYVKTAVGSVAGIRVDPHDHKIRIPFLLSTPDETVIYKTVEEYAVYDGRGPIIYDKEVLETYSFEEDQIFKRINETLFKEGLLIAYEQERQALVTRNDLMESEVIKIANTRLPNVFQKQLEGITAQTTLARIRAALDALGRPKSFYTILDKHEVNIT